jgi:hypothetical protein
VALQENLVTVAVAEGAAIDLRAIPAQIARVGFKPADMVVRAVGSFEGEAAFRPRHAPAPFALSKVVHPVPDTVTEVTAGIDTSGEALVWTMLKVGP